MTGGKFLQTAELPIAESPVEARSLKTERVQVDMVHPAFARLGLRAFHQRPAPALATMRLRAPEQVHKHPAQIRFGTQAADDLALVSDRHRKPTKVDLSDRLFIVRVQPLENFAPRWAVHSLAAQHWHVYAQVTATFT